MIDSTGAADGGAKHTCHPGAFVLRRFVIHGLDERRAAERTPATKNLSSGSGCLSGCSVFGGSQRILDGTT
jgi:hypothetical protein